MGKCLIMLQLLVTEKTPLLTIFSRIPFYKSLVISKEYISLLEILKYYINSYFALP